MTYLQHVEMKPADWVEYWERNAPQATFSFSGIDRTVAPKLLGEFLNPTKHPRKRGTNGSRT